MALVGRTIIHAIRSFRRSPGLVLVGTLSLALGIASNVTIFTAVNALVWHPMAYPAPDQLIQVWSADSSRGWDDLSVSLPDFLDWRRQSETATLVATVDASYNLAEGDRPERIMGMRVSPEFFHILGTTFTVGRGFRPADELPGADRVAVLSHRFWARRFGSDTSLVGRSIVLDGEPCLVLGITPPSFRYESNQSDVWVPLIADPGATRGDHSLRVMGRLTDRVTITNAQAELGIIARRLAETYPASNRGLGVRVIPFAEELVEAPARQAAAITMVAVAFVLLIACANVANLLLARATGRDRELAVRSALGADRRRLITELLIECLVLATAGGALGLALSFGGVAWFRSIVPADFVGIDLVVIDWVAFGYTALITLASGLVFGLAPALRSTRPSLATSLRDGGRGATSLRHGRILAGLVAFEIALALVLLISAGLLIKASVGLQRIDPGFDPSNTLSFRTALAEKEYPDSVAVVRFQEQLLDRLASVNGVVAVGAASSLPMQGGGGAFYRVDGDAEPENGRGPVTQVRGVTPGYLTAAGITLLAGRDVARTDRFESPRVVLINRSLAKQHWPNQSPLGGRIRFYDAWWTIVGVVQDTREFGLDDPAPPVAFVSMAQSSFRRASYVLRTREDPASFTPAVREQVRTLAPNQPIYQIQTLTEVVRQAMATTGIMPRLLGVFGAMALLLATIGVYGVIGYAVAQRTQEMGVRRALGAQTGNITRLVLRQAMLVCVVGVAVGLVLSLMTTRSLAAFLLGVSPFDAGVFGGVTATLLGAALVACLVPVRRATRVDPIVALRSD